MRAARAVAVVVLLAGCGGEDVGGEAPAEPRTEVRITVWPSGKAGPSRETTLRCDPPGGTHPDPEAACAALAANEEALAPVPPDAICTQIYGGRQEARVTGVVRGRRVDAAFSRRNGCEIARWDRLKTLFAQGAR